MDPKPLHISPERDTIRRRPKLERVHPMPEKLEHIKKYKEMMKKHKKDPKPFTF
jgi:hypothetical protein